MEGVVAPIAILLVVSSSKGNTIPFRWPPRPARRQRTEQPEWKTSKGHIGGQGFGGGWSTGRRTRSVGRGRCLAVSLPLPTLMRRSDRLLLPFGPAATLTTRTTRKRAQRTTMRPSSPSSRGSTRLESRACRPSSTRLSTTVGGPVVSLSTPPSLPPERPPSTPGIPERLLKPETER